MKTKPLKPNTLSNFFSYTLAVARGLSCISFLAAASIDLAAPSNSFSAITVGSSGSTKSVPVMYKA